MNLLEHKVYNKCNLIPLATIYCTNNCKFLITQANWLYKFSTKVVYLYTNTKVKTYYNPHF